MDSNEKNSVCETRAERIAKRFEKLSEQCNEPAQPHPAGILFQAAFCTGGGAALGWGARRWVIKGSPYAIPFGVGLGLGVALGFTSRQGTPRCNRGREGYGYVQSPPWAWGPPPPWWNAASQGEQPRPAAIEDS